MSALPTSPMRRILLALMVVAPLATLALFRAPLLLALAPLYCTHALLLYATLAPNSQWWGPVLRSFQTEARELWITIDDGPSPALTPGLLDLLDRLEGRATFFVIGERAEKYPHLITEILSRGHALANHTMTHPAQTFWFAGPRVVAREIARCAGALRSHPERPALFFRAPAGMKSPLVHPALQGQGLSLVGWSSRGLDTVLRDPERVAARVLRQAAPGAIVLLHDHHRHARDPELRARVLEQTLQRLAENGYRFVIPAPEKLRTRRARKGKDDC